MPTSLPVMICMMSISNCTICCITNLNVDSKWFDTYFTQIFILIFESFECSESTRILSFSNKQLTWSNFAWRILPFSNKQATWSILMEDQRPPQKGFWSKLGVFEGHKDLRSIIHTRISISTVSSIIKILQFLI